MAEYNRKNLDLPQQDRKAVRAQSKKTDGIQKMLEYQKAQIGESDSEILYLSVFPVRPLPIPENEGKLQESAKRYGVKIENGLQNTIDRINRKEEGILKSLIGNSCSSESNLITVNSGSSSSSTSVLTNNPPLPSSSSLVVETPATETSTIQSSPSLFVEKSTAQSSASVVVEKSTTQNSPYLKLEELTAQNDSNVRNKIGYSEWFYHKMISNPRSIGIIEQHRGKHWMAKQYDRTIEQYEKDKKYYEEEHRKIYWLAEQHNRTVEEYERDKKYYEDKRRKISEEIFSSREDLDKEDLDNKDSNKTSESTVTLDNKDSNKTSESTVTLNNKDSNKISESKVALNTKDSNKTLESTINLNNTDSNKISESGATVTTVNSGYSFENYKNPVSNLFKPNIPLTYVYVDPQQPNYIMVKKPPAVDRSLKLVVNNNSKRSRIMYETIEEDMEFPTIGPEYTFSSEKTSDSINQNQIQNHLEKTSDSDSQNQIQNHSERISGSVNQNRLEVTSQSEPDIKNNDSMKTVESQDSMKTVESQSSIEKDSRDGNLTSEEQKPWSLKELNALREKKEKLTEEEFKRLCYLTSKLF